MDNVLPIVKKHSPLLVILLYVAYTTYTGVDRSLILVGVVTCLAVYAGAITYADTDTKNSMESELRTLRTENDGLKQNLMKVYSMVQQRTQTQAASMPAPAPTRSAPSQRQNDTSQRQTDTPTPPNTGSAQDETDGKPYM
jgi:hypothetical protein